ncbi:MAG: methyltransferase domain-containing protein [Bacteroidota bacterium]
MNMNKDYWEQRYKQGNTGWDIGYVSEPLRTYINQLDDKSLKILIPGSGNGYEAEYLWRKGFKNVYTLDIAKAPLEAIKERVIDFPDEQLLHQDFFKLEDTFDLIIEQTFFCALDPKLRKNYVEKMHKLLNPSGKLVGLLFDFELTTEGPPFGGDLLNYTTLFKDRFHIKTLETAYNSIKPRLNKELFFIFEKNNDFE